MMRSRSIQLVGYTLLALAVAGFLLTQVFQCSVSTTLVPYDPRANFDPTVHPLLEAIYTDGTVADIKILLNDNPDWVTKPVYQDWYAVHCAAQAGRPEVLQLLVDTGADIHVLGGPGNANVVVSAFESDDPDTLKWVLDAGADPHIELLDGTPLEYIREFGSEELNRVLDERDLPDESP